MQRVRDELLALPEGLIDSGALLASFDAAFDLGVDNGFDQARDDSDVDRRVPSPLRDLAAEAPRTAMQRLADVARSLLTPATVAQLAAQLARANAAVTSVERAVSVGVNLGSSIGLDRVAAANGADKLWLPERDACLHCLRYAGLHVPAGQSFPGGLTYDRKPLSTSPIANPPLHPNCRCRLAIYYPRTERPGEVTLPEALKREATRSVARGFSLPTESETRRIEAAERLLRQGVNLPESVKAYARRAVDRGEFPRGRNVPSGTLRP